MSWPWKTWMEAPSPSATVAYLDQCLARLSSTLRNLPSLACMASSTGQWPSGARWVLALFCRLWITPYNIDSHLRRPPYQMWYRDRKQYLFVSEAPPLRQVEIRPMMYVALTYDHRLIDGREAVTFLRKIKAVVEDPRVLLLDMWASLSAVTTNHLMTFIVE